MSMLRLKKDNLFLLAIFLFSLFVFARGLNVHGVEYRDDEIFYYQSTQEMIQFGNYFSPTYFEENRFQKPILFYWFVIFSYKIFGINWFAARFVSALFAGLSVLLTWLIGKELFSRKTATLAAFMLMVSPLFFRHAKNAVPDMCLNFFVVAAMYCVIRFVRDPSRQMFAVLFFVSCALGFMIKGFAAVVFPIGTLAIYSLWIREPRLLRQINPFKGFLVMAAIILPWFLYMIYTHGLSYLEYMFVKETKERVLIEGAHGIWATLFRQLFDHSLFYLQVIGSYFAPWSIFLLGAVPLSVKRIVFRHDARQALGFLLIWVLFVFFVFSSMYFIISHYMLVLSTPLVLLIAYFLMEPFEDKRILSRIVAVFRKYFIVFCFTIGMLAYSFVFFFLLGANKLWLIPIAGGYLLVAWVLVKTKDPFIPPLAFAVLGVFILSQTTLMDRAGFAAHSTLKKFARTVNATGTDGYVIGVCSTSLHEKEFQVFFDRKIELAASIVPEDARNKIYKLFDSADEVFCLMTEKDYDYYFSDVSAPKGEVVQEDYLFRKKMYLTTGFFIAVCKLDTPVVLNYLKEKIVLVRKGGNV